MQQSFRAVGQNHKAWQTHEKPENKTITVLFSDA